MSTIEGSGRTREPGEIFRKKLADAVSLDDSGYVLKASSATEVDLADATDYPFCVNYRSTKDPFDVAFPPTTFLTGDSDRLVSIDVFDDGEVALKVADNNAAISVGDPICVAAAGNGKVDKYVPTSIGDTSMSNQATNINSRFKELGRIVGYAVEAVDAGAAMAPGADKVRVRLTIKQCPVIA